MFIKAYFSSPRLTCLVTSLEPWKSRRPRWSERDAFCISTKIVPPGVRQRRSKNILLPYSCWLSKFMPMVPWLMVVWSSVFLLTDPFVSEISIVEVALILDWLQNSEHVSESIRNIAIIILKNDKETYKILKKQKFLRSYPQRNLLLRHFATIFTPGKTISPDMFVRAIGR